MITVELADDDAAVDGALALAQEVWGAPSVSRHTARALTLAGWYVAAARDGDDAIGMSAAVVGVRDGALRLHSHLTAVRVPAQGQGVGRALKRHQRQWALANGIETITWTFDPLVRENARFNLHHLGAIGDRYLVDLYGEMDDDINHGQPSDRLLVRWPLLDARVVGALEAPITTPSADRLREAGAVDALATDAGRPVLVDTDAPVRLLATPEQIVELRRRDPELALEWRLALREAMVDAIDAGLAVTALADGHHYVLSTEHA